jgi:hypothetical protein
MSLIHFIKNLSLRQSCRLGNHLRYYSVRTDDYFIISLDTGKVKCYVSTRLLYFHVSICILIFHESISAGINDGD